MKAYSSYNSLLPKIVFVGNIVRIDGVLLQHMPLPVVSSWKGFCALPRVVASGLSAVEQPGVLEVFIMDVPLQVRDRPETPLAPWLLAGPWPVVIPLVMAAML